MIKGNEKDCICHKSKGKHQKHCDAFRMAEFIKYVQREIFKRNDIPNKWNELGRT